VIRVDAHTVDAFRAAIAAAPRVAIDTEFHAERRYHPQLYLIQVATPDGRVWIIDPLDPSVLGSAVEGLAAPDWVVHGGAQDLRLLAPLCGRLPERVLDTQIAAAFAGHRYPAAFGELSERWLGLLVDKGESLSDWSRRPLTEDQLRYAAGDVSDLLALWDGVFHAADAAGFGSAVLAACSDARANAGEPAPDWRRIPAAIVLDARGAAVLDALVRWREAAASETDLPPKALVSDAALLDLARRRPTDRTGLLANRKTPKPVIRSHGDALLQAIGTALQLPESALPAVLPHRSDAARRVAVLAAVCEVAGDREGWAHALVTPRGTLEAIAARPPGSREALAARWSHWQDTTAGDLLWAALCGQVGLLLDKGNATLVQAFDRIRDGVAAPDAPALDKGENFSYSTTR
jgi:ribonuclease D